MHLVPVPVVGTSVCNGTPWVHIPVERWDPGALAPLGAGGSWGARGEGGAQQHHCCCRGLQRQRPSCAPCSSWGLVLQLGNLLGTGRAQPYSMRAVGFVTYSLLVSPCVGKAGVQSPVLPWHRY